MKARLFVVNEVTRKRTIENKEVSVYVPEPDGKPQWNRSITDIVSDLMQVEIGDYIFLWEMGTGKIYGVYRAVSDAFFAKETGRNDIFRIKIDVAYSFNEPIMEYDMINNPYMKNKLWNIIGKKVAGKARGTSPITKDETQFLIQALIDANETYVYYHDYEPCDVEDKLAFNLHDEYDKEIPMSIEEYDYEPLRVVSRNEVHYEKALEGILNHCFRERKKDVIAQLDINENNVIWYANYLPYGLEKSEIDYMVMESMDGENVDKIDVLELKAGVIDMDHIRRCLQYAKWVVSSVANGNNIVRPVLICGIKSVRAKKGFGDADIKKAIKELPPSYGFKKMDIYTYIIENGEIIFQKYHGED